MKIVMVLMLVAVLGALGSAGVLMMRRGKAEPGSEDDDKPADKGMARALALRVALSVALFLFILLSWYMGWVKPGGIPVGA